MTYDDSVTWWQILRKAEKCVADVHNPEPIRQLHAETIDLCMERLRIEGLTREQLKQLVISTPEGDSL